MIRRTKLAGTTNGGGDATVTASEAITGRLLGVQYNASALDATADTTLTVQTTPGTDAVTITVLTNYNTDDYLVPSPGAIDQAGAAIAGAAPLFLLDGFPRVVIAQGGATKAFDLVFYWDDLK